MIGVSRPEYTPTATSATTVYSGTLLHDGIASVFLPSLGVRVLRNPEPEDAPHLESSKTIREIRSICLVTTHLARLVLYLPVMREPACRC